MREHNPLEPLGGSPQRNLCVGLCVGCGTASGCIRVVISSRLIGFWQLGTTDGEAQRTPLVCAHNFRERPQSVVQLFRECIGVRLVSNRFVRYR